MLGAVPGGHHPAAHISARRERPGLRKNDLVASLREELARRVDASRRDAVARLPKDGVFAALEVLPKITFVTRGRVSGLPREKWWLPFAPDGDVLYLLEENGTDAHWVRNVVADPRVIVEGAAAVARVVDGDAEMARARELCRARFARLGLLVADVVERGLVVAFEPRVG